MNEVWNIINQEANHINDETLQHFVSSYVRNSQNLSEVVSKILVRRYADHDISERFLTQLVADQLDSSDIALDLMAYFKRDFACTSHVEVLFLNRGFLALCAHRMAHRLWKQNKNFSAKWLQKKTSEVFNIDIHPAAQIGCACVIDHCFGIVIGETSIIGDHVFIFHNVTLGGKGHKDGNRHPKVGSHVVIGAGAIILGNIEIGNHSVIAAGSVVLENIPSYVMVAGIPARIKQSASKLQTDVSR